jgi:RNA polymerase sigma-70 factor (ECF subfamily)
VDDARDDRALLTAWQAGDRVAGDALLQRHHPRVFRFFRTKLPDAASDLAQQTFVAALEARERIAADRSFVAYLLGIARHLLFDALRRHRPSFAIDGDVSLADVGVESASSGYALREEKRLLLDCLRELPLDQQLALELYYWEDLSTPEIAAVLEVAEGTVRSRLTRARELLRARLETAAPRHATADALRTHEGLDRWARGLRDRGTDDG